MITSVMPSSRRRFLRQLGGCAALAASVGPARRVLEAQDRLTIGAVDAYPVYLNQRSEGLFDPPAFVSDDDPSSPW